MKKRAVAHIGKMRTGFGICVLITALLYLPANDLLAEDKPAGRDDFGAETVVGEDGLLPLSLVEETDGDIPAELEARTTIAAQEPEPVAIDFAQSMQDDLDAMETRNIPASEDIPAGVRILSLLPGGPLAEAGLRQGDVVQTVNGQSSNTREALREQLLQGIELSSAVIVVRRENQEIVIPMVFGSDASTPEGEEQETTTVLNVTDVDIAALIKTFSKLTKRNYILDSSVKGTVTIHLPTPVTLSESLRILDTVLLLKGFTTVPVAENTWKVVSAKDAKQTTIPLVYDESGESDVMVTKMVRLKHTSAADIQQLLAQFVSKDGFVNAFEGTNSLIIIDSALNIDRLQDLIQELDVPAVDQEMSIIPILHADAADIAEKINEILGNEDEGDAAPTTIANRRVGRRNTNLSNAVRQQQQQNSGGGTTKARSLAFKIIPDERTNSIIVIADAEMSLRVKALVEQLDSELDRSSGRFYVYRLQHADSEEVAEILNSLLNGTEGSTGSDDDATQGSSLSSRRSSTNSSAASSAANANQARLTRALRRSRDLLRNRLGNNQEDGGRVNLEGEVSIAPDPATNSLVINASRTDYSKIKEVIQELDIKRRQVIVEATILEITLSDSEGMGVELQGTAAFNEGGGIAQTNYGGLTNLLTNPAALTDLTIAAASSGTVTLPGGITIPSQAVLISAVSRLSNVNVLSAPTIMATDNQEAEIIVGQNVPFVTSTSTDTSNINNTFNTIERQDVGITLRITPQISTGEFVVLNIFVEISNVVPGTANDANGPTTTIRTTETAVTVKNGQMVVTGGLIQDSVTDSTRGVPFLQDVPVLGHLFKTQNTTIDKTNLLILITPRVIADQFEARLATKKSTVPLEKHIDRLGLTPDRREVFENSAVDSVVESYELEANQVPTVITPPLPDGISAPPPPAQLAHNDVVELNVAPELPGMNAGTRRSALASQSANAQSVSNEKSGSAATNLVLLRPLESGTPRLLALELPQGAGTATETHFQVGAVYSETTQPSSTRYVCIGRYGSLSEAKQMHPALGATSATRLAPSELVGLGTSAWVSSMNADSGSSEGGTAGTGVSQ